ncbi:MAG: hypothetical protein IPH44_35310 [Myxococcales bacterium]|jgi:hypothetical protein|nr:hypothetical protein [Myxococcales bacterium]MBK7194708.1 hypothetical protein [Myxococcales bacterium]MBP6847285.1 hypothetical protein [Kofleriaceae bacterium]
MEIGHRLAATLGFVVPAALAAWITLGVDAHAAPPDIRPLRFQQYGAFQVRPGALYRHCEPQSRHDIVCECFPGLEVEVATDRVGGAVFGGFDEPRFVVPRTGGEWNALRHWLALQRAQPIYDFRTDFKVVARPGVPYRDIIRVFELADQAGLTAPRLVSSRAAELDRPGPLRVTVTPAGVGADFFAPHAAHLPPVRGERAWRVLATWLADRRADPRLDGNDLRVELDLAFGTSPSDVARVKRTLERAGYDVGYYDRLYERWGGVAM